MGRTAATGSGEPEGGAEGVAPARPRPDRWRTSLILVLTRRCDLRCAYCPTVKDGLPDLTEDDVRRAYDVYTALYGGGEVKLFGGEPLLVPHVVEAAFRHLPDELRLWLSTNGTHLSERVLDLVRERPGTILTVSLDGAPGDHDGLRRAAGGATAASYDAVRRWLPALSTVPGFTVTQTIAPSTAARAAANFAHLRSLGIRRFNLLPGYYVPWRPEQLAALEASFAAIGDAIEAAWAAGEALYLRNLFVRAPQPFFNSGMVVDVDRTIHPSNVVLAASHDELRGETAVGTLDAPPTLAALDAASAATADLLAARLPAARITSTHAVDAQLTRLCNRLYRPYLAYRARGRQAVRSAG